ncbi:MAG: hypothetical protein H6Q89_2718 [Myxococcaceae bacterium]|nr:hypothetical protein [Myxococcaceae bacterium]
MHTIEIKKTDWPEFFRTLNRRAADQPVRLEVERRDLGDQQLVRLLPLREIDFETKGSDKGDLLITVAAEQGELTHRVQRPQRIYALLNDSAELAVVAIDEPDQGRTLVYFEHLLEIPAETYAP